MSGQNLVEWMFFDIIFALAPVLIIFLVVYMSDDIDAGWHDVLRDGELFIFSTAVAASSIGDVFFEQGTENSAARSAALCTLFIVLVLSTALFGMASYRKLKGEGLENRRFSAGSVGCACLAGILSYWSYSLAS
jgi:hypothetical protein